MKMAIQPISRTDYVSHVSFEGGHKKGNKKTDGGQHMTPAAKAIPIVVLMSMSPLTQCATAENYNKQVAFYPTTEVVVQNPQEPELPNFYVRVRGEFFRVWGVSGDKNPNDAEWYLFRYKNQLKDHRVALLEGQFIAISETPREEDGRYLMLYKSKDENGNWNEDYKMAYVPSYVRSPLFGATSDRPYNHNAAIRLPMDRLMEGFGEDAVKNAPNIEDATSRIVETDKN